MHIFNYLRCWFSIASTDMNQYTLGPQMKWSWEIISYCISCREMGKETGRWMDRAISWYILSKDWHINKQETCRSIKLRELSACGRFVSHTKATERNAGWQHMGRVPHPNYVDLQCCVATVCHQVHFMYWEHLGHFHSHISFKVTCICNLESPNISYGDSLRVEHRTSLFSCLLYVNVDHKL